MNVVVEPLPNCLATLRVEVEAEKVVQARDAVTRQFGQDARIPGYRPGKAPRPVIERKFKRQIQEELERKLLSESTRQAISEKGLRVLQIANIEDVKIAEDNLLSYTATVITHPEFPLPEYKGIPIEVRQIAVTDDDVEQAIEELRENAADFQPIEEDRGAEMEDFVVVDYTGTIDGRPVHEVFPKGGKPLSGNLDFWIKMTDEAFFPGFCQALLGAKPDETRKFTIDVPADFPVEGMPGQKIDYEVKLKQIMHKILPELNDEFANTVVKDADVAKLRILTRQELEREHVRAGEASKRQQIMSRLLSWVECELPDRLVRSETQRVLSEIVREHQSKGVADELLRENERELVGQAAHTAREKLKGTFILLRIAEQEGIRVTREELMQRIAMFAARSGMTFEKMVKELEKRNAIDQINEEILTTKVMEFLVANAVPSGPLAVPAALPEAAPAPSDETASTGETAPEVQG